MDVAADAGAEDLSDEDDRFVLVCAPGDVHAVSSALEAAGMAPEEPELAMVASGTVPVAEEGEARRVLRLLEALDDDDDVQNVWSNFDIPDEVLAAVTAD